MAQVPDQHRPSQSPTAWAQRAEEGLSLHANARLRVGHTYDGHHYVAMEPLPSPIVEILSPILDGAESHSFAHHQWDSGTDDGSGTQ
jgi:hypothetical protein